MPDRRHMRTTDDTFVGTKLNRTHDRVTLWIVGHSDGEIAKAGTGLDLDQVEQLIWRLANLREHMAQAIDRRRSKPSSPPATEPPARRPALRRHRSHV